MTDRTSGHLLNGRVILAQPRAGHRTGIEPVLVAASVPARPGERVCEAGSGSGAGLLCLAARVPGVRGVGVEIDPGLAELAGENARANGFEGLDFRAMDIGSFRDAAMFDHAFANPPWHERSGTPSADTARETARRARSETFSLWAGRLARGLRHRGTLTFVVATAALPDCLAAFAAAGCGSPTILPLWPREGASAKLTILRGVRGGRGPARLLSGLVLHSVNGSFTAEADAVLRRGEALMLD